MSQTTTLGAIYKRLGLSPTSELVARRSNAIQRVADNVGRIATDIVRAALSLKCVNPQALVSAWVEADAAFEVDPADAEFAMLAGRVLLTDFEAGTLDADKRALMFLAATMNGTRSSIEPDLLAAARQCLANAQGKQSEPVADYKSAPTPGIFKGFLDAAPPTALDPASVHAALKHLESSVRSANKNNANVLRYARRIEGELRLYWWVVGGWSKGQGMPFDQIETQRAALVLGFELADISASPIGHFSSPAMLLNVLKQGRTDANDSRPLSDYILSVTQLDNSYAAMHDVNQDSTGLFPVRTGLRIALDTSGSPEWTMAFKRTTGLDSSLSMSPVDFAYQVLLETLASRAAAV